MNIKFTFLLFSTIRIRRSFEKTRIVKNPTGRKVLGRTKRMFGSPIKWSRESRGFISHSTDDDVMSPEPAPIMYT